MTLLFSFQDVDMYDRDAELFEEGEWLNDTCIHFGLQCLQEQYDEQCSSKIVRGERELKERERTVKLVDPAVVSFLRLQVEEEDEYEELSHGLALPQYDWLVLPINDNTAFNQQCNHWSLLLCHIPSALTFSLDSCGNYNLSSSKALLPKLAKLCKK